MDRRLERTERSPAVGNTEDLLSKWGPGLASWPLPLAAYLGLAVWAPELIGTAVGFVAGLAAAALAGVLLAALISKALGLYRRDAHGEMRADPARQGIFAAETALVIAYFILPRLGIEQPIWLYVPAFFVVGAAGMAATGLVAGRRARLNTALDVQLPEHPSLAQPQGSKPAIAPTWAQRIAATCMALGGVALIRLLLGGESYFLWGGLVLLAFGALLPSIVVMFGGGRTPDA